MENYNKWKRAVDQILTPKEQKTMIDEDIVLDLLYHKVSHINQAIPYHEPGQFPFMRGHTANLTKPLIIQSIPMREKEVTEARMKEALEEEVDGIELLLSFSESQAGKKDGIYKLEELLKVLPLTKTELHIKAGKLQQAFIDLLASLTTEDEKRHIQGAITADPFWLFMEEKLTYEQQSQQYETIAKLIRHSPFTNIRLIGINTGGYRQLGANVITEVALALAIGVEYIEGIARGRIQPSVIGKSMVFSFSVGSYLSIEIAKIRAFRALWAVVMKEYCAETIAQKAWIEARADPLLQVKGDPHLSIVKVTVSAIAAILSGVQQLSVRPFDENESNTHLNDRLARHAMMILRDEAFLHFPIDSIGGSYYIESLTEQIAEKAWKRFIGIEQQGGVERARRNGWLKAYVMM
ncbi:methylmalonyl-CoA mutase family protein [Halalkalibacter sp. APA_J-10(15)]|uniref:methylmalonyl-CoA mutase family protein n=1 Tax=Halalkalibacter sp. APA_J-10(15) TaxID=2933805 RepID=UPI001FF2C1F1|nr:methylmalonyl-CoA mutase family protein [Halalkalibacter sp. APA_J-10(15)]MCK0473500.1 methylmalonyl-CoA mutase family protein [Halalkalibacter sp. APA_J-10(15)]